MLSLLQSRADIVENVWPKAEQPSNLWVGLLFPLQGCVFLSFSPTPNYLSRKPTERKRPDSGSRRRTSVSPWRWRRRRRAAASRRGSEERSSGEQKPWSRCNVSAAEQKPIMENLLPGGRQVLCPDLRPPCRPQRARQECGLRSTQIVAKFYCS